MVITFAGRRCRALDVLQLLLPMNRFHRSLRMLCRLAVMSALLVSGVRAAPSDFDTAFGNGGVVRTNFSNRSGSGKMLYLLRQPDGRLIGIGQSGNGSSTTLALARFNANGSIDTSFGSDGRVVTGVAPKDVQAIGAVLQADGKILVLGDAEDIFTLEPRPRLALLRYLADGSPDPAFGSNGMVRSPCLPRAIALQADGRILVACTTGVQRFLPNGALDTGFGIAGTAAAAGTALAVQADGRRSEEHTSEL